MIKPSGRLPEQRHGRTFGNGLAGPPVRLKLGYERTAFYPANDDPGMPTAPGRQTNVAPACGWLFS